MAISFKSLTITECQNELYFEMHSNKLKNNKMYKLEYAVLLMYLIFGRYLGH